MSLLSHHFFVYITCYIYINLSVIFTVQYVGIRFIHLRIIPDKPRAYVHIKCNLAIYDTEIIIINLASNIKM